MSVYRNTCGRFAIELTDPSPMWVKITGRDGGDGFPCHITSVDLYDLRYLVERAIAAAEERERDLARRGFAP